MVEIGNKILEIEERIKSLDVPTFDPEIIEKRKDLLIEWLKLFWKLSPEEQKEHKNLKDRAQNVERDRQITDHSPTPMYTKPVHYPDTESGKDVEEGYY